MVSWPEFSSWGGVLEFAFSRSCQTFGMGRSSVCAEGDQGGLRHRGTWKWPSDKGMVWVSALHFGRFSGNFAFSDSRPFFLSSQRFLCTSLWILAVTFFTSGGQEVTPGAASILRGSLLTFDMCRFIFKMWSGHGYRQGEVLFLFCRT